MLHGLVVSIFVPLCIALVLYINTKSDIEHYPLTCKMPSDLYDVSAALFVNTTSKTFLWRWDAKESLGKAMGIQIKGPKDNTKLFVVLCGDHSKSGCTKEGRMTEDEKLVKYVDAIRNAREFFVVEIIFETKIVAKCDFIYSIKK